MPMKYLYWLTAAAIFALGIYLSSIINVQPQTASKIKFSQFLTAEEFGKQVFEKFKDEIKAAPILFLGVTPNQIEDMEFWRGFLEANQEKGWKYDVIVVEPMLPYVELFASDVRVDINKEMARFADGVIKARDQGLRVAVIVPNIYSAQIIKNNPVNRFMTDYSFKVLSFSVTSFPVTRQQEEEFSPKCIFEEGKDMAGTGAFGCVIQTLAKKTYRMKFEDNKYSGLVEQMAPQDYVILLNRNAGSR